MSDTTDTRVRDDGSKANRRATLTQTTAGAGSMGGGVILLMYAIACIHAHALVAPTVEQAAGILIIIAPFFHLVGRVVMYWTGRLIPKDETT